MSQWIETKPNRLNMAGQRFFGKFSSQVSKWYKENRFLCQEIGIACDINKKIQMCQKFTANPKTKSG